MDLVVYDDEERRYVPWLVSVAAVVLTGVLAAGITFLFARSPAAEQIGGVSSPQAATTDTEPSPAPQEPSAAPSSPEPEATPPPRASPDPDVSIPPSRPSVPPPAAPAQDAPAPCLDALGQADAVLERSAALQEALAEQTRVMDELLAQRLTTDQALDQSLPVLTRGATDRKLFAEELASYQRSRGACPD